MWSQSEGLRCEDGENGGRVFAWAYWAVAIGDREEMAWGLEEEGIGEKGWFWHTFIFRFPFPYPVKTTGRATSQRGQAAVAWPGRARQGVSRRAGRRQRSPRSAAERRSSAESPAEGTRDRGHCTCSPSPAGAAAGHSGRTRKDSLPHPPLLLGGGCRRYLRQSSSSCS